MRGARPAIALLALATACVGGKGTGAAEAEGRALRFAEALGGRDTAVLRRLVTEGYVVHAAPLPSGEIRGRAAFLTGVASGTGAWPPGRVIVTHLLSDGNEVAVYGFFQEGGSPLSPSGDGGGPGPRVSVAAVNRMEGGRIAETWAVWDSRALDELRTRSTAVSQDPGGND